jgi:hypothetical protein
MFDLVYESPVIPRVARPLHLPSRGHPLSVAHWVRDAVSFAIMGYSCDSPS